MSEEPRINLVGLPATITSDEDDPDDSRPGRDGDLARDLLDFLARPIPDEILTSASDLARIAEQRRERTRAVVATVRGWPHSGRSTGSDGDEVSTVDPSGVPERGSGCSCYYGSRGTACPSGCRNGRASYQCPECGAIVQ